MHPSDIQMLALYIDKPTNNGREDDETAYIKRLNIHKAEVAS